MCAVALALSKKVTDLDPLPMRAHVASSSPNLSTQSHSRRQICGQRRKAVGSASSSMLGRVTLSASDTPKRTLREKDDGPAFDEPWQAQVLGIADRLVDVGVLSSKEWAEGLGQELRSAAETGAPDNKEMYYSAVLAVLEKLLGVTGTISREELDARVEAWRRAYLATPHGNPVELPEAERSVAP